MILDRDITVDMRIFGYLAVQSGDPADGHQVSRPWPPVFS